MDKNFKYRFKTLDELKIEYGPNFRSILGFNTEGYMDHLFGQPIEVPERCVDEDGTLSPFDMNDDINQRWSIYPMMLTKYIYKPSYKPKTFIRE